MRRESGSPKRPGTSRRPAWANPSARSRSSSGTKTGVTAGSERVGLQDFCRKPQKRQSMDSSWRHPLALFPSWLGFPLVSLWRFGHRSLDINLLVETLDSPYPQRANVFADGSTATKSISINFRYKVSLFLFWRAEQHGFWTLWQPCFS